MNQSTRAITLVLISAGSVLAAHHAFDTLGQGYRDMDAEGDRWAQGSPTTRQGSGGYYGHSHYYYYGSRSGSGGWSSGSSSSHSGFSSSSSSSSSSAHGTSFGGFGGTAHGSGS